MGGKFLLGRPVPGPYARSFCDTNADVQSVATLLFRWNGENQLVVLWVLLITESFDVNLVARL